MNHRTSVVQMKLNNNHVVPLNKILTQKKCSSDLKDHLGTNSAFISSFYYPYYNQLWYIKGYDNYIERLLLGRISPRYQIIKCHSFSRDYVAQFMFQSTWQKGVVTHFHLLPCANTVVKSIQT